MKYKYIGTIVGKQRLNGEITVVDIPDWLPEIPNGTRIKIGYTEQFADDYTILYWKNKKNKAYINVNEIHSA